MKSRGFFQQIARTFRREPRLHPIDRQLAKRWIKQRLLAVYPELRGNPAALERAYEALSLEPRAGDPRTEADTVFEITAHRLP